MQLIGRQNFELWQKFPCVIQISPGKQILAGCRQRMQIASKNLNNQAKKRLVKKANAICIPLHTWTRLKELEGHSYDGLAFLLPFQSPFLTEK